MHIVLGASGQVGSAVVKKLIDKNVPVRAIVRSEEKVMNLLAMGAEVAVADARDLPSLQKAFQGGTSLFVLTPETGQELDVLGETSVILENYRHAWEGAGIDRLVGLSSIGAQHDHGTGNLLMSNLLEHAFDGMRVHKTFIRPAYFFSNWLAFLPVIKESGILPTYFPLDLAIPMVAPLEVATCIVNEMLLDVEKPRTKTVEVLGPGLYTSLDVAEAFSDALNTEVVPSRIPRELWSSSLAQIGFTPDAIRNFIEMTDAVIDGRAAAEGVDTIYTKVTLREFIKASV
ncbi:NmrA family NAD(P)-binding protein [Dyadobacter sandarakinus]|uniref:NAD(P)H-binding protein n=1 Tax=Dyadobacter sandarakinus TaxID=2747268 RepID=A0ABX7I5Q0_9BACT|nr:NAD(P)H-binding protein [Dyadobacter sandarakinus]QRR00336.1 NAD(P)H-binding protein [Dyadobacter sandarakinus]